MSPCPDERSAVPQDRVPLIVYHKGCGWRLCPICLSTTGPNLLLVPTQSELAARRTQTIERSRRRATELPPLPDAAQRDLQDRVTTGLAEAAEVAALLRPVDDRLRAQPQRMLPSRDASQDTDGACLTCGGEDGDRTRAAGLAPAVGPVTWTGPTTPTVAARPRLLGLPLAAPTTAPPGPLSCYSLDRPQEISADERGLRLPEALEGLTSVYATGCALGDLPQIDTLVAEYMRADAVPKLSVTVIGGDGRLKLAKAYTYPAIDRGSDELATPYSRFRIKSVSKIYTAILIMQLLEAGVVNLMQPVSDFVDITDAEHPDWAADILVWHLLCHVAGWDRDVKGTPDPSRDDFNVAATLGDRVPIEREQIRDFVNTARAWVDSLGSPWRYGYLLRPPGSFYAYSNYGMMLAADVVEKAWGSGFSSTLEAGILDPIGARSTALGHSTRLLDREVQYWTWPWRSSECGAVPDARQPTALNVRVETPVGLPGNAFCTEFPYGAANQENRYGASRIVSNALDVAKLGWELSPTATPTVVGRGWRAMMQWDWSAMATGRSANYGLGLQLNQFGTGTIGHGGTGDGCRAELVVYPANLILGNPVMGPGAVAVVLCNRRKRAGRNWQRFTTALLGAGSSDSRGIMNIMDWGTGDLWDTFGDTPPEWL